MVALVFKITIEIKT